MRSMVEGHAQSSAAYLLCPSTTLRVVPLPLRGRNGSNQPQPVASAF